MMAQNRVLCSMIIGMYQDVYRVDLLEVARRQHPLHLLVCAMCGWSWLTMETAKISLFLESGFQVTCLDAHDCYRRQRDQVGGKTRK